MKTKVLLDTDIGSDIDDAVCLAYLLAQPDCDLLGITTVTGEADRRAALASALCIAAGRSIPIFPGREIPLLVPAQQTRATQAEALARWPHETVFPRGEAVEFMRQTIRHNPGEVVLLAIGPLTNVAALLAADPEIPTLLKGLVLMCGAFFRRDTAYGPVEWNAKLDPHATSMVYKTLVPQHRSIGLDVTSQVRMPAEEVRQRFQSPLLRPVLDFAEVWFQRSPVLTFHDPLAAVTIFDDAVCTFENGQAEIELCSERLAGYTHWKPHPNGPQQIALEVDSNRFFAHYFSVLTPGQ